MLGPNPKRTVTPRGPSVRDRVGPGMRGPY
jgi:hypothetical protein